RHRTIGQPPTTLRRAQPVLFLFCPNPSLPTIRRNLAGCRLIQITRESGIGPLFSGVASGPSPRAFGDRSCSASLVSSSSRPSAKFPPYFSGSTSAHAGTRCTTRKSSWDNHGLSGKEDGDVERKTLHLIWQWLTFSAPASFLAQTCACPILRFFLANGSHRDPLASIFRKKREGCSTWGILGLWKVQSRAHANENAAHFQAALSMIQNKNQLLSLRLD